MPFKDKADRQRYNREYLRARYAALREAGLCIRCGKEEAIRGKFCDACYAIRTRNDQKKTARYRERRELGICPICGKVQTGDGKPCAECRSRYADRYHTRLTMGVCPRCGKPTVDDFTLCADCRARKVRYGYRKRVERFFEAQAQ